MTETIWGPKPYEERFANYKAQLANTTLAAVLEIANTSPGSDWDAPFAMMDPARAAAARELVVESDLQKQQTRQRRQW